MAPHIPQNFRPVAFSCSVRRDEPEIPRRVAHACLAVAVIPVRRVVQRGSAGLQSLRVDLVGVLHVVMQSSGHGAPSGTSVRELDDRIAYPGFRMPDLSAGIAH